MGARMTLAVLFAAVTFTGQVKSEAAELPPFSDLKDRMEDGEVIRGTFLLMLQSGAAMKYLGREGLDFYIIDTEHGVYDDANVSTMIEAGLKVGMDPWVRVPEPNHEVSHALDMGARGVVVPLIETAEQAAKMVEYGRYMPDGKRGYSTWGATDYLDATDVPAWLAGRNREVMLVPMIETPEGVANADEILAVEGIDGVIVGTGDLSYSLGHPGNSGHPEVEEAILQVMEAGRRHNKWVSFPIYNPAELAEWHERGMNPMIFGADAGLLSEGIQNFQRAMNAAIENE